MHQSLSILEVLSDIFSACDDDTLSTLARTCKSFEDPALDLLWRHQTSFVSLLKTLPADLWEVRPEIVGDKWRINILHFRRPLVSTDLDVFNKYARRMTLVLHPSRPVPRGGIEAASGEAVEVLSQHMSRKPILPNLREFRGWYPALYHMHDSACFTVPTLLLGPKIEKLVFYGLPNSELPTSFIHSIKSLCPSLTSLHLSYPLNQELILAISDLICHFDNFKRLQVGCLTTGALSHIATLSTLRHLILNRLTLEHFEPTSGPGLAHLSELSLTTYEDITAFLNFFSLILPHQLQSLFLTLYSPGSSMQWRECFRALSRYCPSTLTFLYIVQVNTGNGGYVIGHTVLEPLFTMHHLTYVILKFAAFDLGDEDVKRMALAWPHLLELELSAQHQTMAGISRITLMGLVPVLEHCPDLQTLTLPIDATVIDLCVLEQPGGVVSNDKITEIGVGDARIEDAVAVAAFLSFILPNIKTIRSWHIYGDTEDSMRYRSLWDEVPHLIQSKPSMEDSYNRSSIGVPSSTFSAGADMVNGN